MKTFELFLNTINTFFIIYLLIYSTYLFISVLVGAIQLYKREQMAFIKNELQHDYYVPVSILVPAYNEEVTIVDSINSLVDLDYRLYEIIIIDDGSKDRTIENLIQAFQFVKIDRPIRMSLPCAPLRCVYETKVKGVSITLISKENGGKGESMYRCRFYVTEGFFRKNCSTYYERRGHCSCRWIN